MSTTAQRGNEVVSLDERLLYLRVLRAVLAGATVLDAALLPGTLRVPFTTVGGFALIYLVVCLAAEAVWRVLERPGLWVVGSPLLPHSVYPPLGGVLPRGAHR